MSYAQVTFDNNLNEKKGNYPFPHLHFGPVTHHELFLKDSLGCNFLGGP